MMKEECSSVWNGTFAQEKKILWVDHDLNVMQAVGIVVLDKNKTLLPFREKSHF